MTLYTRGDLEARERAELVAQQVCVCVCVCLCVRARAMDKVPACTVLPELPTKLGAVRSP